MKTSQIINKFGINQTLINMSIDEMKSELVNESNFFDCTVADWNESEIDFTPDHKSDSGSQYMFTDKGVYRKSNHWTNNVNTCIWVLNGLESNKDTVAFCTYENFKKYSSRRENSRMSNLYVNIQEAISDMLTGKMIPKSKVGNLI